MPSKGGGVLKPLAVGTTAGFLGTVAANQVPQNQKASRLSHKVNQLKKPQAPKPPSAPTQPGFAGKAKQPDPVAKKEQQLELHPKTKRGIDRRIAGQKKFGALTALTGGTLGLAALGTRGRAHLIRVKNPEGAQRLKDLSLGLTTVGAGVGGVGAYNSASYLNAESKREKEKLAKNMDYELFMPYGEPVSKELSLPHIKLPRFGSGATPGAKVDAVMNKMPTNARRGVTTNRISTGQTPMPKRGGVLGRTKRSDDAFHVANSPAGKAPGTQTGIKTMKIESPLQAQMRATEAAKPASAPTQPDHEKALGAFRQRFAEHKKGIGVGAGMAGAGALGFYGGARHQQNKQRP